MFGEVEFATVMTDERGKSLGYGVIDFAKKMHAMNAIDKCRSGCFILTRWAFLFFQLLTNFVYMFLIMKCCHSWLMV